MAHKVWLITGASSGFGRIMTDLVLQHGYRCVATSIEPDCMDSLVVQYGTDRLLSLFMDVTKEQQVQEVFKVATVKFGGIDFVFSNAGTAFANEVESTPDSQARKLFDVNFWGVINVMRESIKVFRDVNGPERGGKLLQMASIAGIVPFASLGYYCASKHAVEGLTKTLVLEIKPEWNIQVTIIEPGFFRTGILDTIKATRTTPTEAYTGGSGEHNRSLMEPENIQGDPAKAMKLVLEVAESEKLPLHLPIGPDAIEWMKGACQELTLATEEWGPEVTSTLFG